MKKVDLKKQYKHLLSPSSKEPEIVDVPPLNYLMVDGQGDPNTSQAFHEAMEALYSVAYTLKFMLKKGDAGIDYPVMALEGLWWVDNMAEFGVKSKEEWNWTCMIMQPDFITGEQVQQAVDEVRRKKNPPALPLLRFESFHEGLSAQIMHIGPYAEEGPTIEKLHSFIKAKGFALRGKHHEIYLGEPRRAVPEKLRTILRQPIAPTSWPPPCAPCEMGASSDG